MVRQIEIETRVEVPHETDGADKSANAQLGDVPCLFGTLASQRYNWDDVIRIIAKVEGIEDYKLLTGSRRRELVNKYPLFVSWYCAVRLELGLKAVAVPYFGASAYVGVFEWSPTGGMVHLIIAGVHEFRSIVPNMILHQSPAGSKIRTWALC